MTPQLPHRFDSLRPFLQAASTAAFVATIGVARASGADGAGPAPNVIAQGVRGLHERVLYNQPGDGSLWARGRDYKSRFDRDGATYYPRFGAAAPHDMPQRLSPDRVTSGDVDLHFAAAALPQQTGERVEFDRGAFTEYYDLAPNGIEQSFVFESLPNRADLVVRIPMGSELAVEPTADGLRFESPFGSVTYDGAAAVDAAGRRLPVTVGFADGAVVLRVAANALAGARLPLVIDPFVSTVFINGTTTDHFQPDVAWDDLHGAWLTVFEETFSATDTDVFAQSYTPSGSLVTSAYVDLSSEAWATPRCAFNRGGGQFLVVAERTSTTPHTIRGCVVTTSGVVIAVGTHTDLSDGSAGDKTHPTVGGDPFAGTPSYFMLAYTQAAGSSSTIAYRRIESNGTAAVPVQFLPQATPGPDDRASISKSNDALQWVVAFQRTDPVTHADIWAARIHWDGALFGQPFGITSGSLAVDTAPSSSSRIRGTTRSVISFTHNLIFSANHDILVAAVEDTTVLDQQNLNTLENSSTSAQDQIESSVDCDGRHFLVAYSEQDASLGHYVVFGTELYLAGDTLGLTQGHVLFHQFGLSERNSLVSAAHDANSTSSHFFAVYDVLENATNHDVDGALYDAVVGGTSTSFCFGTAGNCPCANGAGGSSGCINSIGPGATLSVTGTASSSTSDSVHFIVSGVGGGAPCLFFQGTAAAAPSPFGDGLLCTGGAIVRLAVKFAIFSGFAFLPGDGEPGIHLTGGVPSTGGLRVYQAWYRDSGLFCTAATFNTSNAVSIAWAP